MPPRKEPKETVTYPPSKRKAPPFKPQRPSQIPPSTTTSQNVGQMRAPPVPTTKGKSNAKIMSKSVISSNTPAAKGTIKQMKAGADRRAAVARKQLFQISSSESEGEGEGQQDAPYDDSTKMSNPDGEGDTSDDMLVDDPITARPTPGERSASKRASKVVNNSFKSVDTSIPEDMDRVLGSPVQSELESKSSLPRALLTRIVHEHFSDPQTKIDKQAMQLVDRYLEVFVHEAIARTSLQKREDVNQGKSSQSDIGYLELSDLEKVTPGLLLDF